MSKQRVRLLVERVLRIKEEPKHNMDKTEGKDFEVRLEDLEAKHEEEIIDYERRQQAGRPIGSGRMEKCVDQVIGNRQKGKGMSWTKPGSRALALLKVAELNARSAAQTACA